MNYYDRLNISQDADKMAVKRAYFTLVKTHTPDLDPVGFKEIRTAYETLMDDEKREAYDSVFSKEGADNLLAAREMMRNNSYKQAVDFLTAQLEENPADINIKRMLAEALGRTNKRGKAETLCKEILADNPGDVDTWIIRGNISHGKGHTNKAMEYFEAATVNGQTDEAVAVAWSTYLSYVSINRSWLYDTLFRKALSQNPNMFNKDYIWYLKLVHDSYDIQEEGAELAEYLETFVKLFLADKRPKKAYYDTIINCLAYLFCSDDLVPIIAKMLPALESSPFRSAEHEEDLTKARAYTINYTLRLDDRIHPLLVDLTSCRLDSDFDADLTQLEAMVVVELPDIRQSIKALRDNYAEAYRLNGVFYALALDTKKETHLRDKYIGVIQRMTQEDSFQFLDEADDSLVFDLPPPQAPFTREAEKTGRNAPCPCGSGKKYKRCCG